MKTKGKLKEKQGISLIVLVITIIVIVILAVAVILSIANNNPISNANKARFQNDVKSMQEELELIKSSNYVNNNGAGYGTIQYTELNGSDKYPGKFAINEKGELGYIASKLSTDEITWAEELGLKDTIEYTAIGGSTGKFTFSDDAKVTYKDGTEYKVIKNNETEKYTDLVISPEGELLCALNFASTTAEFINGTTIWPDGWDNQSYNNIENLEIPSEVKKIGNYTFSDKSKLKNVKFQEGVTEIGEQSFMQCTSLESVELPKTLEKIGKNAFSNCSKLKSIRIPENVQTISESSFMNCGILKEVEIASKKLTTIEASAFEMTKIQEIFIPKSVTTIGSYALGSQSLTKITIENGSTLDISKATDWGISEVISTDTSSGNTVLSVKPY